MKIICQYYNFRIKLFQTQAECNHDKDFESTSTVFDLMFDVTELARA